MLDPCARKVDQHFSYVRCLVDSAQQSPSHHAQQAHLQSALLQMGMGWHFYLLEINARYGLKSQPSSVRMLGLPEDGVWLDRAEGQELSALLRDPRSWLSAWQTQLQALWQMEQRTGLAGDLFSYQESASELIAATAEPELPALTAAQLDSWAGQFQALVHRQRGCQEEY